MFPRIFGALVAFWVLGGMGTYDLLRSANLILVLVLVIKIKERIRTTQ